MNKDATKEVLSDTEAGFKTEDNVFEWAATMTNVPEPYAGGTFELDITFPEDFPFSPPKVIFTTPIYHPNVDENGEICIPLTKADVWRPMNSIVDVLVAIRGLLTEPNPADPLRAELAQQYLEDRDAYLAAAAAHTAEHATK